MNVMDTLLQLQAATLEARTKTGDENIGTRVAKGLVDVVRAVPPASGSGAYAITVLCAGLTPAQAVEFLGAMQ